jgi:xylulokinase
VAQSDQGVFFGLDAGTGGLRAVAVSQEGLLLAQAAEPLPADATRCQSGCHEQEPEAWWQAACRALRAVTAQLTEAAIRPEQWQALAVDGTSGTLLALDRTGRPLRPALMYNDPRGAEEADRLNQLGDDFCRKLGYRFAASYAAAKIGWLRRAEPDVFARTARFVHQADYLVEQLAGHACPSDYSNALKTGYDLVEECWPDWLVDALDAAGRLPAVVAPGKAIAQVSREAAAATGLRAGLTIVTGVTDGTAGCLASGVRRPGDYNTTLGTTLVFKGISRTLCRHAQGLVYCHKLPGGYWLPGAASNTGAEWIGRWFPAVDPAAMDQVAGARLPSDVVAYPLVRTGERFPVLQPKAEGFFVPQTEDSADRYAACLQGTAFLERRAYEVLDRVAGQEEGDRELDEAPEGPFRESLPVVSSRGGGEVFSTGGGSRSDVWMQCRADVTGRTLHRPRYPESAFGAAVLAAGGSYYNGWAEAVAAMVHLDRTFTPDNGRAQRYEAVYRRFRRELDQRGYV